MSARIVATILLSLLATSAHAGEDFVRSECDRLGLGIHEKAERAQLEDGSTDIVLYTLFCGVELQAQGSRELTDGYTVSAGNGSTRHWGYLEYVPTKQSVKRQAVENGQWAIGTWKTRASGRNYVVVLHSEPIIVNGNWSYCTDGRRHMCRDDVGEKATISAAR